jgi:hypothetical protein
MPYLLYTLLYAARPAIQAGSAIPQMAPLLIAMTTAETRNIIASVPRPEAPLACFGQKRAETPYCRHTFHTITLKCDLADYHRPLGAAQRAKSRKNAIAT